MKNIFIKATIVLFLFLRITTTEAQSHIDIESGSVFMGYNDVRIPGNIGTQFSLKDDLTSKTEFYYRIRLHYTLDSRHNFSLLFAPLTTKSVGTLTNDVFFRGVLFPANSQIVGNYKFNSYRFTYRYDFVKNDRIEFGVGLTAKIRDAKIALSSSGLKSEKTNVGFVPIINLRLLCKFGNNFGFLLDGDALAAPQGRAADILIAATYKISENIGIRAGYRILEGGADNNIVYNFALFHYASLGFSYKFKCNNVSN